MLVQHAHRQRLPSDLFTVVYSMSCIAAEVLRLHEAWLLVPA